MPFLDSLDIANRTCQHIGATLIASVTEDSKQNREITFVYDKVRRAELRRNNWRFAIKKAVLRPVTTTTLLLNPALWSSVTLYLPGSIVRDANGILWSSTQSENLGNDPAQSYIWDQYFGPLTADEWDSTTTYSAGELVYVVTGNPGSYVVFKSLENDNADTPTTATAWSSTTTYGIDQVVSYSGLQWRSLIAINTGVTPAQGPLNFDVSATYSTGNTVTATDGYIYSSVGNGNVGHDPTTDGGVNWTNTTVPNAWSASPVLFASSPKWLPLYAALVNLTIDYPLGAGPTSQSTTRNIFRLPSGYLRRAPQDPKAGAASALGSPTNNFDEDWEFDGDYLVSSDAGNIIFRFVADVMDVTKMDDMFCEGLAARMGMETCEAITQSTAKLQTITSVYRQHIIEARLVNGIEQGAEEPPLDDYLACRY